MCPDEVNPPAIVNQGSTSTSSVPPFKRGRGRPRKLPTEGEAVRGFVVEATNDQDGGGYLINVRIGNSPISFRGIVTAENDNNVYTPETAAPPKHKYEPRQAPAPQVYTVAASGNLVPVVLKPVDEFLGHNANAGLSDVVKLGNAAPPNGGGAFSNGMAHLLQAAEMIENQVNFAGQPVFGPGVTTEADFNNRERVGHHDRN